MKTFIAATAVAIIAASSAQAQSADASSQSYSSSGINSQGDSIKSASAFAPSGNNTAPCVLHPSGGIGVAGVGVSAGSPYIDKDCIAKLDAVELRGIVSMDENDPRRIVSIIHLCKNHKTLSETMSTLRWCEKVGVTPLSAGKRSQRSTRQPVQPQVAYTSCEIRGSNIAVGMKAGSDVATAKAQCRAALGL